MSTIHFVGGEKGGVGKSVMSRLLSQYFLDKNLPYLGLDADQSHATLTRYYPDFTQALDLDTFESTDRIMELALETDRELVIDLPAQSQRFLDHWIRENEILEFCEEMQLSLCYWYVVDDGQDSRGLLDKFLTEYGDILPVIVVKNQGCGKDFSSLEALPNLAALQAQIALPALYPDTMRKIDTLNFSFWSAVHVKDGTMAHLGLMERRRVKVWLNKVYPLLDEIFVNMS